MHFYLLFFRIHSQFFGHNKKVKSLINLFRKDGLFLKVKDIMTSSVQTVEENDSLVKAAQLMKNEHIGSVPVKGTNNRIVGMVTDRDIVLKSIAEGRDPHQITCKEIMSTEIVACSPTMEVDEVAQMMAQHQIRRVPVIENNTPIGIVSLGDLATKHTLHTEAGDALTNISYHTNTDNNLSLS